MAGNITKPSFIARHRYWIMGAGILLFMPPLSVLFQFTGDSNFCGTWCPRMFFVWRQGMSADAYFSGFLRSYMGVLMVDIVLISTLFLGRYWCSHICPVGAATELGSRLVPKSMKIDFSIIPAPSFRYGYLSVYLLASAFGIGSLCCSYCNFATVPRFFGAVFSGADLAYFLRTAGMLNLMLLVFMGFFSRGGRAYCNLMCPIGAIDALFNRFGVRLGKRVRVSANKCSGCGRCVSTCPNWAIELSDTAKIDPLSCMPCRICETACPQGAINYVMDKATADNPIQIKAGTYANETKN